MTMDRPVACWSASSSPFRFILETRPAEAKTDCRGRADLYWGVATGSGLGRCAFRGRDLAKIDVGLGRSGGCCTGKCVGESSGRLEPEEDVVRVRERG